MTSPYDDSLDMITELYLSPFREIPEENPHYTEAQYLEQLKTAQTMGAKLIALISLIGISRSERRRNGGRFTQETSIKLLCQFETQIGTDMEEAAGEQLIAEGAFCESLGDFQGAVWLYEGALRFKVQDRQSAYFRLNNLGFCLNYLKRFDEAQKFLEEAIDFEPRAYNAWKNAGVSFECQGKPELAVKCYMHAINKSGGEARSIKHMMRIIERHPELKKDEYILGYLDSLKRHGRI